MGASVGASVRVGPICGAYIHAIICPEKQHMYIVTFARGTGLCSVVYGI